jgi:hypothetical protein
MRPALLACALLCAAPLTAQPAPPSATEQEHRRELDLLHIGKLRPPRDATHPARPDYANYDEDVATRLFTLLPDPLTMADGTKVTTRAQWLNRRKPELMALFERDVLGRRPASLPGVAWTVTETRHETVAGVAVVTRKVTGHVDNRAAPDITVDIALQVTTPEAADGRRLPAIIVMGSLAPPRPIPVRTPPGAARGPAPAPQQVRSYPDYRGQILARGWGYVIFDPLSVQADNGAGFTRGIIGLANKGRPRSLDDWGSLSAWGWGISRAMDYLETDSRIDATRVGLFGHSRYGKAAVVTMMYEPRIAVGYISSSGKGGAAPYRRVFGSTVENMSTTTEFQWQNGRFMQYAADPLSAKDMPVDANEALALIAPRALFVSAGKYMADPVVAPGDGWVDGKGSFEAEVSAGAVYRLMGRTGLDSTAYPALLTLVDGDGLAFRQHDEGHTPAPNWASFLDFAAKEFRRPPAAAASR